MAKDAVATELGACETAGVGVGQAVGSAGIGDERLTEGVGIPGGLGRVEAALISIVAWS